MIRNVQIAFIHVSQELFQDIVTERNFLVQWRRQDLARGGAQNDIEIT